MTKPNDEAPPMGRDPMGRESEIAAAWDEHAPASMPEWLALYPRERVALTDFVRACSSAPAPAETTQPPCSQCGGPHPFDTTVPSAHWNAVIRAQGLPDYLCLTCIVREFAKRGESFAATLTGDGFHRLPIEVRIGTQEARTAHLVSEQNTRVRAVLSSLLDDLCSPSPVSGRPPQPED